MTDIETILRGYGPDGDVQLYIQDAKEMLNLNKLHEAASLIDRAFCIDPSNEETNQLRNDVLNTLSVTEHGLDFRYIPAGTFLMGSQNGDPDEMPEHPVFLPAYWISSTPLSWEVVCHILGIGTPPEVNLDPLWEDVYWKETGLQFCKIILQYCEDETLHASEWHSHDPSFLKDEKLSTVFSKPQRKEPDSPYTYKDKPVVAVDWHICLKICQIISEKTSQHFALPTEAEWEKAARGGLYAKNFAWGDESPEGKADYGRFEEFSVLSSKAFSPNGYGLYASCGGVSEWTQDWYDAQYYSESPQDSPTGPSDGKAKVLRGGSWSDCPEACTVSFRTAVQIRNNKWGTASPNIGFRICKKMNNSIS